MRKEDGFVRLKENLGAVVNIDNESLKLYKASRNKQKEINTLKEEVSEIKQMLLQLIAKETGK